MRGPYDPKRSACYRSHERHEALLQRLEDALDRLSVHERDRVTMDYAKLSAELGLSD